jgi:transposase
MVDAALEEMSPRFARLYSRYGRPSIAPEKLLRALLLQVLYSVRSERLLMEQLGYNLLFRWFVGLSMDDGVWDVTVFTKNRERLLEGEIAEAFFEQVNTQARAKELLSDEHFTVDGTLVQAWAGRRIFDRRRRVRSARLFRTIRGIRRWIFTERSGATKRTYPQRTRRLGCIRRVRGAKRS